MSAFPKAIEATISAVAVYRAGIKAAHLDMIAELNKAEDDFNALSPAESQAWAAFYAQSLATAIEEVQKEVGA